MGMTLEFKEGKTPILLATDVAARGLGKCLLWQNYRILAFNPAIIIN